MVLTPGVVTELFSSLCVCSNTATREEINKGGKGCRSRKTFGRSGAKVVCKNGTLKISFFGWRSENSPYIPLATKGQVQGGAPMLISTFVAERDDLPSASRKPPIPRMTVRNPQNKGAINCKRRWSNGLEGDRLATNTVRRKTMCPGREARAEAIRGVQKKINDSIMTEIPNSKQPVEKLKNLK